MRFKDDYAFLSNMYKCSFVYKDILFSAAEIAYVYEKCKHQEDKDTVLLLDNPYDARKFGRSVELVDNWESKRLSIMYNIILAKFEQNTNLARRLSAVDEEIVEDNTWGDTFWGRCNGVGENNLGKLLTLVKYTIKGV